MLNKLNTIHRWFKQVKCSHSNVALYDTGYRVVLDDGVNISHFAHLRCKDCSKVIWRGGYERVDALGIVEDITGEGEEDGS